MTTSAQPFIDTLRKSRLLSDEQVDRYLADHPEDAAKGASELANGMIREGLITRFQAGFLLQGKHRGFILRDKYKVLDLLGSGGMGRVYLCEQVALKRRVAVKMLPAEKLNDPETVERFYREAIAIATLDHPNIVRVHDVEKEGNLPLTVMEFIDGKDLHYIVNRDGVMDFSTAANVVYQAALGLQHAHEAGLVHRDIKPSNLLLDSRGIVKILDLGLARFFSKKVESITKKYDEDAVLGTAEYLSPEQALSSKVDIRSDIYGLGATLYYLLIGMPPFVERTVAQILMAHQSKPVPKIADKRPDVPRKMEAYFQKMMAKKVEDRFQTPQQVADAFRELVTDEARLQELAARMRTNSWSNRARDTFEQFAVADTLGSPRDTPRISERGSAAPPAAHRSKLLTIGLPVLLGIAAGAFGLVYWLKSGADLSQPAPNAAKPAAPKARPPVVATAPTGKPLPISDAAHGDPEPIAPADAAKFVGQEKTVVMTVANAQTNPKGSVLFINAKKEANAAADFLVFIPKDVAAKMFPEHEFEELAEQFANRKMWVRGKVEVYKDKFEIKPTSVKQLGWVE